MLPELNPDLNDFITKHIDNFVKWDLVAYFHQNPDLVETPSEIAVRLGRRLEDVSAALDDLVAGRILCKQEVGAEQAYSLVSEGPEQKLVAAFVDALDSRGQRLQILTKLLRLGARA